MENYKRWTVQITRMEEDRVIVVPKAEWTDEDFKKHELNTKTMYYICCAMNDVELTHLTACRTAKEMWDKLENLYDGISNFEKDKEIQPDEETKPFYAI